jgi:8-oxo-dGTP pyrophosphatase MutT (NUDIX family)
MADAISRISTRLVYENRWLRLREDQVRRRDGSEGIYSVLERAEFAVICPVQDGVVHMVEQFRYPIGQRSWEFPMGTWEWREDVDPRDLAAGELREESGLHAGTLIEIGRVFQAAGYSDQAGRVFFATDLRQGETALEHEEQDMI